MSKAKKYSGTKPTKQMLSFHKKAIEMYAIPKFPPVPNTDNEVTTNIHTRAVTKDGEVGSGVVASEGEALFSCIAEKEKSLNNCSSCCPQDFHYCAKRTIFLKIGFIDDDIPSCFKGA